MNQVLKSTAVVAIALWTGVLCCIGLLVAPYLFVLAAKQSPSVPNTGVAADLIGPLLYGSDVVSLVVGVGLVSALFLLRRRGEVPLGGRVYLSETSVAVAVACAAINYWWFGPRIKAVQVMLAERYGAFHRADPSDALFLQFDTLHRTSTSLFLTGLVCALIGLVCMTQFRSRVRGTAVAVFG